VNGDTGHGSSAYRSAGVDYSTLDAGKRNALTAALATSDLLLARPGGRAHDASRGEPAFVFDLGGQTLALVLEGLGTKSIIARQVYEAQGLNHFADVAYDAVAAIINDLCCVGASPTVVCAYFATGSSNWYSRNGWQAALIDGWQQACRDAGATWGGGESPSLPQLVSEDDIELAGSAIGILPEGLAPVLGQDLGPGDEIVLIESSGLHANGASLARMLAGQLEGGYATPLRDGQTFGEALLAPTILYSPLVDRLLEARLPVHYLSHITGHGLLKLMRPERELTYRISTLPAVPAVLRFMAEESGMSDAEAYSTLNMGCGFAVYCGSGSSSQVIAIAEELGLRALAAGQIEAGPRRVVIEPLDVVFESEAMDLNPRRS